MTLNKIFKKTKAFSQKDSYLLLGIIGSLGITGWVAYFLLLSKITLIIESLKSTTPNGSIPNTFYTSLPIIIASIAGAIAIIYTLKIYQIKKEQLEFERERAKIDKERAEEERKTNEEVFKQISVRTNDIAFKISQALIETPDWFGRYMDEMGVTFSASIFGKRFKHFYFEKKAIAKRVIKELDKLVNENNDTKYYLIIESGTTMFSLFPEITRHLEYLNNEDEQKKKKWEKWQKHVCIITNNIPGAQYLMKNCKENPSNDDSEMAIDCYLMPGKVNSDLAATECNVPEYSFKKLIELTKNKSDNNKVIGFLTGHHIVRSNSNNKFYPVTSEETHKKIKEEIAQASDEIYLIAPLMQFSCADVDALKNAYTAINKQKKYNTIDIPENKSITVFTSKRGNEYKYKFKDFSDAIHRCLQFLYGHNYIKIVEDFKLCNHINYTYTPSELQLEIPDEDLRALYGTGKMNVWDKDRCDAQKKKSSI